MRALQKAKQIEVGKVKAASKKDRQADGIAACSSGSFISGRSIQVLDRGAPSSLRQTLLVLRPRPAPGFGVCRKVDGRTGAGK